mgnify:CR=1 FL=1
MWFRLRQLYRVVGTPYFWAVFHCPDSELLHYDKDGCPCCQRHFRL